MADTRVQIEVEDWVRNNWMPANLGQNFIPEKLPLTSGGVFDFDAVSKDKTIASNISTSGARTASGKNAVGKLVGRMQLGRYTKFVRIYIFYFFVT